MNTVKPLLKKSLSLVSFLFLFSITLTLAFNPYYSSVTTDGILLWAFCVLPSLFPYFFITAIMSKLKVTSKISKLLYPLTSKLFNVGGECGYALIMSLLSGYPVGAKTVSDLKLSGLIGKEEGVRASVLCSTSSPMFLISSVGSLMFNDMTFGLKLFGVHILSCLIVGFIFSFYKRKARPTKTKSILNTATDNVLYESAYSSVISVLVVGGLITVFYLLTEILFSVGILNPFINLLQALNLTPVESKGVAFGLFECTKGLKVLASAQGFLSLPFACFICGFGGVSVICQSLAYLKKANIKTAPFLVGKLTQAVLGFIIGIMVTCL